VKRSVTWRAAIAAAAVACAAWGAPALATRPAEKNGPRIAVEPESFNFGATLPHKTLTKEFLVRNVGNADLFLEEVTTTCGCTAALPQERQIKPGGHTQLRVSVETRAAVGSVDRYVRVRSNDKTRALLEIKLSFVVGSAGK
jgi:hypothetical protein